MRSKRIVTVDSASSDEDDCIGDDFVGGDNNDGDFETGDEGDSPPPEAYDPNGFRLDADKRLAKRVLFPWAGEDDGEVVEATGKAFFSMSSGGTGRKPPSVLFSRIFPCIASTTIVETNGKRKKNTDNVCDANWTSATLARDNLIMAEILSNVCNKSFLYLLCIASSSSSR